MVLIVKSLGIMSVLLMILSLFSAFEEKNLSQNEVSQTLIDGEATTIDSSSCDPNIWKHVYNPTRLTVITQCITVTGVLVESRTENDGDQHMLLKLDAGQENLLTKKNLKAKKGNLVLEIVCINKITDRKVGGACKGYVNNIRVPRKGSHIKVTGTLVLDTHNGWNEIHPVSKIVAQ